MTARDRGAIRQVLFLVLVTGSPAGAQVGPVALDLMDLSQRGAMRASTRELSELVDGEYRGVRVGPGLRFDVAWVEGITFSTGTIELDVRGQDLRSRSFVGLSFGAANDSTYESVFLRPFNFRAADRVRRNHAIQYQSLPTHPWSRLRTEFPEVYEGPADPAPDPNGWVRLKLVVEASRVLIFAGETAEPDLIVDRINASAEGRLGLWVGNFSGGDFANLRLDPTPAAR